MNKSLEEKDAQIAEQEKQFLQDSEKRTLLEKEIEALRKKLSDIKKENQKAQDNHDYNEAETRTYLIDVLLRESGWNPKAKDVEEYPDTHDWEVVIIKIFCFRHTPT